MSRGVQSVGEHVRYRQLLSIDLAPLLIVRLTSNLKASKSHTLTRATLQPATQSSSFVTGSCNGSTPGPPWYTALNRMDSSFTVQLLRPSGFAVQLCSSHKAAPLPFLTLHHCGQMLFLGVRFFFLKLSFWVQDICCEDFLYLVSCLGVVRKTGWMLQTSAEGCLHSFRWWTGTLEVLHFCFRKITLVVVIFSASVLHSLKIKPPLV